MKQTVGFGNNPEESINEWRERDDGIWGITKTWLEDKKIPKPKRLYGRRWSISYVEKLE